MKNFVPLNDQVPVSPGLLLPQRIHRNHQTAASINTTNQGGTPLSGWYSAHWSIDFANGEAQIRNRHRQAYLVVNSARQLGYSSTPQNGWLLDKVNQ